MVFLFVVVVLAAAGVVKGYLIEGCGGQICGRHLTSLFMAGELPKGDDTSHLVSGVKALSSYRDSVHSVQQQEPHSTSNPIFESTRFELNTKLRQRLHRLVQAEGIDSRRGWVRAFERFQLNSIVINSEGDVLLPSGCAKSTALLERDLLLLDGMTLEKAKRIASTFSEDTQKATKAIKARFSMLLPALEERGVKQGVEVLSNSYNDHVSLRLHEIDSKKAAHLQQDYRVVSISGAHLRKLRSLWGEGEDEAFDADVYSLLTRYRALEGKGWQAGTPNAVQACLQQSFGVFGEAFASPLNCYHPLYFSAFPDIDTKFGSCGSFFDFIEGEASSAACGSYAANPPFCQYTMLRAIEGIKGCLDRAKERAKAEPPLSFIVIVPAWGKDREEDLFPQNYEIEGEKEGEGDDRIFSEILSNEPGADLHYHALTKHPYLTGQVILPAQEHCYVDGFQHQMTPPSSTNEGAQTGDGVCWEEKGEKLSWAKAKEKRGQDSNHLFYRPAPFDTAVFLLQNEAGAKKWPLTAHKERKLREAWRGVTPKLQGEDLAPKYVPRRYASQSD